MAESFETSKCKHYTRHCAFISPCCSKVYRCRLCHDDKEAHEIDRFKVQQLKCLDCNEVQKVQEKCEKCGTIFGAYSCLKCRLFDDDTSKGQFHCDKCGLCRVGGKDNFFHCDRCDMCFGISLKDKHKCVEKVTRANCPVCMEELHTSTQPLHVPRCTHILHMQCYNDCLKTGNYACPTCGQSFVDMQTYWESIDNEIAATPMPEEYRDKRVYVLCKDCHKTSKTPFHVLGLRCQECGSYNTCGAEDPGEQQKTGSGQGDSSSSATQGGARDPEDSLD